MKKITSFEYKNPDIEYYLNAKENTLAHLTSQKKTHKFLSDVLNDEQFSQSINYIYNLLTECVTNYPEVVTSALNRHIFSDAIFNSLSYYNIKEFVTITKFRIEEAIQGLEYSLTNTLEQLEQLSNQCTRHGQVITIEDVKSEVKNLDYVKKGSVALLENSTDVYFRFTLYNTYISPSEPWQAAIDTGLISPAFSQIKFLNDGPSFLLQPLIVLVNLKTKDIKIKKAKATYKMNFCPYVHPHARSKQKPCFGSFKDPINEAIAQLDFLSIVSLIRLWAQTATLSDGWGRQFLHGFQHIFNEAVGIKHANIFAHSCFNPASAPSQCRLAWNDELVYFEEIQKGVYEIKIKDETYLYNPHNT